MNATLSTEIRGSSPKNQLSTSETNTLQECEATIRRGFRMFVDVGIALREIRDRRLYREKCATFEEYLQQWGLSRPYAYQVIDAAGVVEEMSGIPDIEAVPTSVTQARVLLQLKEPEKRREAWKQVVEATLGSEAITAKRVRDIVEPMLGQNGHTQRRRKSGFCKKEVSCLLDNLESCIKHQDGRAVRDLVVRIRQALSINAS